MSVLPIRQPEAGEASEPAMPSAVPSAAQPPVAPAKARDKIKTVDELAEIAKTWRRQGRKIALAHGCFDLMHMGHVRHLEAARAEGQALFVTITTDRFVNKGPGRPVFPDLFRAEMIAALECVDYVAISQWPTGEGVLHLVRPDVYVKGSDYKNEDEDITGKISKEKEIIEGYGGRIVFTDDITFSSSNLINRHLAVFDPAVNAYLSEHRPTDMLKRVLTAIESVQNKRVLLIGDTIVDEYQYAVPMGKTPKENMIAARFENRELFAGGVIAAANHVADFCGEVEVLSVLGEKESHEGLIRKSLKSNVSCDFLFRADVPTTRKCRFVDPGHMRKLFEVYHFDETPIEGRIERQLGELIVRKARDADVVIVTDFGHGMVTAKTIETVTEHAPFLAVNAQSNSANHGYNLITKYAKADYVCIDAPEARLALHDRFTDLGELIENRLAPSLGCDRLIVTHGKNGCVTYDKAVGLSRIPAFTQQVIDTVGAGDAFLAITSPIVAAGAPMEVAGFIGNAVGALKVGIVGHRQSVEKVPLTKFVTTLLK
ncbi:MAG TPA: PfkB family carbohydrate kinase [Candidatus Cybelea sp.]|nr:PfkB family carbohydrate kinase [Candidatus Cybelea sp.]